MHLRVIRNRTLRDIVMLEKEKRKKKEKKYTKVIFENNANNESIE